MLYSALEVAKYTVSKCLKDDSPISNLQLQKILYYIQKTSLKSNFKAFSDSIEAWQFGPVVPNVYYEFCSFGSMPIIMDYDGLQISDTDKLLFDKIIEDKRTKNPWELVEDTHKENGAWYQIYRKGQGNRDIIPVDLIKGFD